MRPALRVWKWVLLSLLLGTLVTSFYTSWLATILGPEVWAPWVHRQLVAWVTLYTENLVAFQTLSLHVLLLPVAALLAVLGGGVAWLEWRLQRPGEAEERLNKLEEDLERFLLVYDENYNFTGRLRKLVTKFDVHKFNELRRLVYQAAHQYCGPAEPGKETFLLVPVPKEEGMALISVVNETLSEVIVQHLLNVRACQMAMNQQSPQLVPNAGRQCARIMTPGRWVLPDCQSLLVCAVTVADQARGVIGVYHRKAGAFSADVDQVFLELMASILSLAYSIRAREVGD